MPRAALFLAFAFTTMANADDKKEKPKVDSRFDEFVTVRRFFPGNKDKDGKPLEFINPDKNIPAFRRPGKEDGEADFFLDYKLDGPNPQSEITDSEGNVWQVKTADRTPRNYRHKDGAFIGSIKATVTLKKKATEKK